MKTVKTEWYCSHCHHASHQDWLLCSHCTRHRAEVECTFRELALLVGIQEHDVLGDAPVFKPRPSGILVPHAKEARLFAKIVVWTILTTLILLVVVGALAVAVGAYALIF